MHKIIVPSEHSYNIFKSFIGTFMNAQKQQFSMVLARPISIVEEAVDIGTFNPDGPDGGFAPELLNLDLKTNFNFLHVGMWGKPVPLNEDRKNISNLVKCFIEEFYSEPDAGLILKISTIRNCLPDHEHTIEKLQELKKALISDFVKKTNIEPKCKIYLLHGMLSDRQLASVYCNPKVKAFISLTHGEGYGLPIIEAAACGLPIIATNWSGHLTFLKEPKNRWLPIDFKLEKVPDSFNWEGVVDPESCWANVNLEDAKNTMRKIFDKSSKPRQWALELSKEIRENYSYQVIGQKFINETLGSAHQFFVENSVEHWVSENIKETGRKKLLYTMPQSAGDVFMSTAIVDFLSKKFDADIYFATQDKYSPMLTGLGYNVIRFMPWMHDTNVTLRIFDDVYTPDRNVQYVGTSWIHGGKGRHLFDEFVSQCGINEKINPAYRVIEEALEGFDINEPYVVFHCGYKEGHNRYYRHWNDVIKSLINAGLRIVQVGDDETPIENCENLLGATTHQQLAYVIKNATGFIGIDSLPMHIASHFNVPGVAIFGASYPNKTGPIGHNELRFNDPNTTRSIECIAAKDEEGKYLPSFYRDKCVVDPDNPLIDTIDSEHIFNAIIKTLDIQNSKFEQEFPMISGYTTVYNVANDYPFIESIKSLTGFCDEVIVVDGYSNDGTYEKLLQEFENDEKVEIYQREWDFGEPGIDGQQKAFARALCTGDYCWQQDCDEIVHEQDYQKIKKLTKQFPNSINILALPIVELWGDVETLRGDRHLWKWRLSKNDPSITHGIRKEARRIDEKTGKVYAQTDMSDGCEYIDVRTHEALGFKNVWTSELDALRMSNPQEYQDKVQELLNMWPAVWHYSWCDLEGKIKNFRDKWDKQWATIFLDAPKRKRFFKDCDWSDISEKEITDLASKLYDIGHEMNEYPDSVKFAKFNLTDMGFTQPKVMKRS